MINILSYVGMDTQSEICLWCLLGLVRTIFDATLFKVNANLKQVWQMNMPAELSMPLQRALRTMVSGIMLVQCFTVYVYLASYIVLLYPVFLEERPSLVLPWLLLAAVRKLLCELTSLALGLGTCLLLGPAKPPCIKFVVVKLVLIMPAFYMWMLVFSYYHALKVAEAFKTFPANLPSTDNDYFDYGLELAVRRRRTKSLLGEAQLRKKLVANLYGEGTASATDGAFVHPALETSNDTIFEEEGPETGVFRPSTALLSDIGVYAHEDWIGSELLTPRDSDRILEQFVLMLLRIGAYLKNEGLESIEDSGMSLKNVPALWLQQHSMDCSAMSGEITETPPNVGSSKGNIASYLREYPHIFMKKQTSLSQTELTLQTLKTVHSQLDIDDGATSTHKLRNSTSYEEISSAGVENVPNTKKVTILDSFIPRDKTVKKKLPESSKAGTSREIPKEDNTIEVSDYQNLTEESTLNVSYIKEISNDAYYILNLSKDKVSSQNNANMLELTENIIYEDSKNNELPLRTQSNDDNIQKTKESKDNNKEVSGYENLKDESTLNVSYIKEISNEALNLCKDTDSSQKNANMPELIEKIIYEDAKNKELSLSIQSNDDNIQEIKESKEEDNNQEVSGYQNLKDESTLNVSYIKEISNETLNLSKDKDSSQKNANMPELIENIIYEDAENKELPLSIQSNDDNIQETKESKENSSDKKISFQTKNKGVEPDDKNAVDSTKSTEFHSKNNDK